MHQHEMSLKILAQRKWCFLDANENPFENGVNRYPDPLINHACKNAVCHLIKNVEIPD